MPRPQQPNPMAEAMHWVSRITSVGLMMVLPILGGRWLDEKQQTGYWAIIGIVLGLALGMFQLWNIAKAGNKRTPSGTQSDVARKTDDAGGSGHDSSPNVR